MNTDNDTILYSADAALTCTQEDVGAEAAKQKVIETILGHHNMPVMMKRILQRMSLQEILGVLCG